MATATRWRDDQECESLVRQAEAATLDEETSMDSTLFAEKFSQRLRGLAHDDGEYRRLLGTFVRLKKTDLAEDISMVKKLKAELKAAIQLDELGLF